MENIGFVALNVGIAVVNLAYVPVLLVLKNIYDPGFKDEANILMKDPPDKKYQTYAMQDKQQVNPDYSKSYGRLGDDDDDDFSGGGPRVTFQETSMNANGQSQYNASWGDEAEAQQPPPPTANPFKSAGGSATNPFRAN